MTLPPVLVFAPVGRDSPLLAAALTRAGLKAVACGSAAEFGERLAAGASALVLTQEAIPPARPILEPVLAAQPTWSDLPLVLLVSPQSARDEHLRTDRLLARNVTVLERPVRTPTLLSVVRSAVRARGRQRELRDLLAHLHELTVSLEERVRRRTRQVRDLSVALTLAEQRERQRLSELLHDHLQQLLFGLQLRLGMLGPNTPPEQQEEHLALARQLLQEAMQLTRTLSVELHPPVLNEDGLRVALEWVASQMRQQHGLEVEVRSDGPALVPSRELLILLTRSVRELLFNVVKRAQTREASVEIESSDGRLRLTVRDGGVGYDPEEVTRRGFAGTGLPALRERLELLGGTMHTTARPGEGTTTVLELPLPAKADV